MRTTSPPIGMREKLGLEHYLELAARPGMGPGRIVRALGKEALQKD